MKHLARAVACGLAALILVQLPASAQKYSEPKVILARLHATFVDATGGRGVLSGDMTLTRFVVTGGKLMATANVDGALADSTGNVLGIVDQETTLPVSNVVSTCNQLSMDLGEAYITVLGAIVHVDEGAAGYDSRDGGRPKARPVLCNLSDALKTRPSVDALAAALNNIVVSLRDSH